MRGVLLFLASQMDRGAASEIRANRVRFADQVAVALQQDARLNWDPVETGPDLQTLHGWCKDRRALNFLHTPDDALCRRARHSRSCPCFNTYTSQLRVQT
mmetsp:Transcript_27680/g.37396  ORF Transcript_27680/g.37396 Transcript_27680/m.37396 type:complete len:100 (+) Transcript_27680:223-522(+)